MSLAPAGSLYPLVFDDYPWSHSLVMAILWGLAFGGVYGSVRKDWRAARVVGALVLSHWLLDLVTHFPDLQLVPGAPARFGLGLWGHPLLALVVELAVPRRRRRDLPVWHARDPRGRHLGLRGAHRVSSR